VYDVTAFMPDHPGGKKAIMLYAGKDASEEFNMLHGAFLCCAPAHAPSAR
jgi:cytochrome b involved in lipid metabolism